MIHRLRGFRHAFTLSGTRVIRVPPRLAQYGEDLAAQEP